MSDAYLTWASGAVPAVAKTRCYCLRTPSTAMPTFCIAWNMWNTIYRLASGTYARIVL
jgi:hypothetical protein